MFDKSIIFVLLLMTFGRISAQNRDSVPELTFDVDTADFGIVVDGDSVVYDFWFTNTGTKNLNIKQAWPACGCTHPTYTQGDIAPGERGKIHVVFSSKNFGNDTFVDGHSMVKEVIVINNGAERYARFKVIVLTQKQFDTIKERLLIKEKARKKSKKRKS